MTCFWLPARPHLRVHLTGRRSPLVQGRPERFPHHLIVCYELTRQKDVPTFGPCGPGGPGTKTSWKISWNHTQQIMVQYYRWGRVVVILSAMSDHLTAMGDQIVHRCTNSCFDMSRGSFLIIEYKFQVHSLHSQIWNVAGDPRPTRKFCSRVLYQNAAIPEKNPMNNTYKVR